MAKYRFFYHYHKAKKQMSVHWRDKCYIVNNITCLVPCETKWNKTQPNLVMRGFASSVNIKDNEAHIT